MYAPVRVEELADRPTALHRPWQPYWTADVIENNGENATQQSFVYKQSPRTIVRKQTPRTIVSLSSSDHLTQFVRNASLTRSCQTRHRWHRSHFRVIFNQSFDFFILLISFLSTAKPREGNCYLKHCNIVWLCTNPTLSIKHTFIYMSVYVF